MTFKPIVQGLVMAALATCLSLPCPAAASGWKAGAASQKITPRKALWMSGYAARNHPATGLLNDLWAKALVLEDERGTRVAIVTLDLVGIDRDLVGSMCTELENKHHLPRANIAVCTSHTHSGPVVGHNLPAMYVGQIDDAQKRLLGQYADQLKQTVVDVVGRAIGALAPGQLSAGHGKATFAVNRRNNKEADAPRLRAEGKLAGPFDHDVPVLKVADAAGKLTAVLYGYACHATVLDGYDWSSDYPGFSQTELESRHPGCAALFFAGCGADQNPLPRRKVELAKQYGQDLAAAVDAVLNETMEPVVGNLAVGWEEVSLEFDHVPSREEVEKDAQSTDRFVAARAGLYLQRLAAGMAIPSTYPYPIQIWRLGSKLVFITLGGEVVVDYALRIKQELAAQDVWVAGYSNDVMAYIPSRRVLTEGGYEGGGAMVYYGLPSPWAPTVEAKIIDGVRRVMGHLE